MKNPFKSLCTTSEGLLTVVNTIAMWVLFAFGKIPAEAVMMGTTAGIGLYGGARGLAKRG